MRVTVHSDDGRLLWFRECLTKNPFGMSSEAYRTDGTQARLVEALSEALRQADRQLGGPLNIPNIVSDVGRTTAQVDHRVPVIRPRNGNLGREPIVETTIVSELPTALVMLKVDVIHHQDVALVGAFHNDNVAGVKIIP